MDICKRMQIRERHTRGFMGSSVYKILIKWISNSLSQFALNLHTFHSLHVHIIPLQIDCLSVSLICWNGGRDIIWNLWKYNVYHTNETSYHILLYLYILRDWRSIHFNFHSYIYMCVYRPESSSYSKPFFSKKVALEKSTGVKYQSLLADPFPSFSTECSFSCAHNKDNI